jgi:uncharacterized protein YjiS (DUF1127 family)
MLRCIKARGRPAFLTSALHLGLVWMSVMSAQIADSQYAFKLPSLSYVDAKWEEPDLRVSSASPQGARKGWWSRQAAAFIAWRRNNQAARELSAMSDRQLADIGLGRSDLVRVFDAAYNQDLGERGRYS